MLRITAWNRLKRVWRESETARKELLDLGFNFAVEFSPNNGAQGRIPVSREEFEQIGLCTKSKLYIVDILHRQPRVWANHVALANGGAGCV